MSSRLGTSEQRAQQLFAVLSALAARDRAGLIARLSRHVETKGDCVVWTGARSGGKFGKTYGRVNLRLDGLLLPERAHRVFLTLRLGRPIRAGFEVGYTCRNPLCVRHVEEQTVQENLDLRDY